MPPELLSGIVAIAIGDLGSTGDELPFAHVGLGLPVEAGSGVDRPHDLFVEHPR